MRTTLNIDDGLMKAAKRRAVERGETVTALIEEALRRLLSGEPTRTEGFKMKWVTVSGRVRSGIDLDDRDALYERMEGRD